VRSIVLALIVFAVCGAPRRAAADERAQVVAILPLAADDDLAIYSKPAADAIARVLRAGGARVESLSLSGDVPPRVALVVDGRIARTGDGEVVLEARVRDWRRARIAVGTITTEPRPLAEIDKLADELGEALAPALTRAMTELGRLVAAEARARREKRVIRLPTTVVRDDALRPRSASDQRPAMLVYQAGGEHSDVVTRHAHWLAERLGYRPVVATERGVQKLPVVTAGIARSGAALALMVDVRDVDLRWRGVLSARGRVRVVLVDPRGRVLFDRVARTDTLVGSRGDGPPALVHYIAEQAVEIVTPHLKRLLAAREAK
jgi:hypothetical protein